MLSRADERGSVMVMVAIWLPILVMFAAFAVDIPHWFDYSRSLQNRADAAARAGALQLGVCLGSTPASQAQLDGVGQVAQQYAGPPAGAFDLPYGFGAVSTYYNQPNLTAAQPADFHLLLNSGSDWGDGGTNFSLGTFCNAFDATDPAACPVTQFPNGCPMVDVRETQANVPMFIKIFGFHPNINAHARAVLQGVGGETGTGPLAVPDAAQQKCLVARIVDESDIHAGPNNDGVIAQWRLDPVANTNPVQFKGAMSSPLSVPPAPDQLSTQVVFPADCNSPFGGGDVYDDPGSGNGPGHGLTWINAYSPLAATFTGTKARVGSVYLESLDVGNCPDPYFTHASTNCPLRVHAQVNFPTGATTTGVGISTDGGATFQPMNADGSDGNGHLLWARDFTSAPESGQHRFVIAWFNGADNQCGNATKFTQGACQFGTVQATFAGLNDGTGTDDSGPIVAADIGCALTTPTSCPLIGPPPNNTTDGAPSGVDSIPRSGAGSSPTLTMSVTLQGLTEAKKTDKPTVLRASLQTSKRTGVYFCDPGQSGVNDLDQILRSGCHTQLVPYSSPPGCLVLNANPISCVEPVTGIGAGKMRDAVASRVNGACEQWAPYKAGVAGQPSGNDPRAIAVAITSPADLALPPNDPRPVHILGFATFYVTGWDGDPWLPSTGTTIPGCNPVGGVATNVDEAYPFGTPPNGAVWGHFIQYLQPNAIGNGQPCDPKVFGDCVPVLTR